MTRKSWPVLTLAGCSFIPVLGIFAGFIAVCWGLVTDRPRGILAAALGAAGMGLNIGGLALIGYSVAAKDPHSGGVIGTIARTELDTLAAHIESYREETGQYPVDLAALAGREQRLRPLPGLDHSVSLFNVSTHYQYRLTSNGEEYQLFGAGRDGIADTADDIFPTAETPAVESADPATSDSAAPVPD